MQKRKKNEWIRIFINVDNGDVFYFFLPTYIFAYFLQITFSGVNNP